MGLEYKHVGGPVTAIDALAHDWQKIELKRWRGRLRAGSPRVWPLQRELFARALATFGGRPGVGNAGETAVSYALLMIVLTIAAKHQTQEDGAPVA